MEQTLFMKQEVYFRKCNFCNVFEATDKKPSGIFLHSHDYTQIWYVTRGKCEHYVEGQTYLMTTGDTFLLPPKVEHKTVLCPDSAVISCELSLEAVLPDSSVAQEKDLESYLNLMSIMNFLQGSKSRQPRFMFRSEVRLVVDRLMREILTEFQEEKPCYQDMLRVKLQELLLLFVREFIVSPDYRTTGAIYERNLPLMEKAIRYIDEHYAEQLMLEDVCRVSTLSKTYFCYLFKLMTKKTFVEYLTERRIHEALRLLENDDYSIQSVSEMLGFNDATHFSRTFKKQVGISPRGYRKLRNPTESDGEDNIDDVL